MSIFDITSHNSLRRGFDYYESKRVSKLTKINDSDYEAIVRNSENHAINRAVVYNSEKERNINTIFITINVINLPANTQSNLLNIMNNYNFNFSEWSYLDKEAGEYIYSDQVVIKINNTVFDWRWLTQ